MPLKLVLGKALKYLHNQWPRLIRYLDDGGYPFEFQDDECHAVTVLGALFIISLHRSALINRPVMYFMRPLINLFGLMDDAVKLP